MQASTYKTTWHQNPKQHQQQNAHGFNFTERRIQSNNFKHFYAANQKYKTFQPCPLVQIYIWKYSEYMAFYEHFQHGRTLVHRSVLGSYWITSLWLPSLESCQADKVLVKRLDALQKKTGEHSSSFDYWVTSTDGLKKVMLLKR
jgi:hypothetical protein